MPPANPCLTCGACCAFFRVSFYWTEADPGQGGAVPAELAEPLPPFRACMQGTNRLRPRCAALTGTIGQEVGCAIYANRPSPCRDFGVQWQEGRMVFADGELERCNRARSAWGLRLL